jgi:hypothetical protein
MLSMILCIMGMVYIGCEWGVAKGILSGGIGDGDGSALTDLMISLWARSSFKYYI